MMDEREILAAHAQIEKVAAFARTSDANWEPIQAETVAAADRLFQRMFQIIRPRGLRWMAPHVSSDGEGAISFEWWHGTRSLTLYAYPDGATESLFAWGTDIWEEMESQANPSDDQIRALWDRLMARD